MCIRDRAEGVPADVDHRPGAHVAAAKRRGSQVGDHGRGDRDEQHDAEADDDDAGEREGPRDEGGAAFVPWPFTFACVIVISFGIVLFIPISSTVVSHLTPTALRGRYMGSWTMVYIGGYALGPLLGGWAMDALGGRVAFGVVAAAGLLGALLFPLLRSDTGTPDEDGAAARAALSDEPRGERPEQAV